MLELKESGPELSNSGYKLTPPGLMIKFDSSLSKDDEKLASLYAAADGISPEEAKQQLLEFIDAVRFSLDKGEVYKIEEVGVFSRDEDQRVVFDIDPNWIIDPDQYGLGSIELLELEDDSEENQTEDLEVAEVETSETPPAPTEEEPTSSIKPIRKWRIIWIVVAALIVIFIVILVIPVNNDGGPGIRFGKKGIVIKKADTKEKTPVITPESKVDETTTAIEETPVIDPAEDQEEKIEEDQIEETPVAQNRYFIIAGSFSKLQNASDLQDELRADGYPSEVIVTENRMYRVSLISYPSKGEAIKELNTLKQTARFENYWVLSN